MSYTPPAELLNRRSDPLARDVLGDWHNDRGIRETRLGLAFWVADAANAHADDADDADAANAHADAANAHADAADDADAANAHADADDADDADAADVADAANAHADAADADLRQQLHQLLTGEIDVKNGLKILQVPGRYGYSVTLVGWLKRVSGDEMELHNACTVARTGSYRLDGLQRLATDGPKKDYDVTAPAKMPEEVHRLLIRRSLPASEKAWPQCPKPSGWEE